MAPSRDKHNTFRSNLAIVNKCLSTNDINGAIKHLKKATTELYHLSIKHDGEKKRFYFMKAERLYQIYMDIESLNNGTQNNTLYSLQQESLDEKPSKSQDSTKTIFEVQPVPSVNFNDVAGLKEVKDTIFERVLNPLNDPELYEGYHLKTGGGIFLYGPPGTGKTMIAAAIAHEINAPFITVKGSDIFNKWQGETENRIKHLFAQARNYKRCVILFDEMDALTPKKTFSSGSTQARAELLSQIQGVETYYKDNRTPNEMLLIIGATNKPWDIDSAFLRDGRFGDRRIYVGLPDFEARRTIIANRLSNIDKEKISISSDLDLDVVTKMTEDFNGSDVTGFFDQAQLQSVKRYQSTGIKSLKIEDFENVRDKIRPSVRKEDLERYEIWNEEMQTTFN